MTTMLGRAAMAAAFASVGKVPHGEPTPEDLWEWMSDDQRDAMLTMVRAVLLAIREADDRMLNAAFNEMNMTPGRTWKAMKAAHASEREIFHAKHKPRYTAMIDAILNERTT
jgi:hypothetical protein